MPTRPSFRCGKLGRLRGKLAEGLTLREDVATVLLVGPTRRRQLLWFVGSDPVEFWACWVSLVVGKPVIFYDGLPSHWPQPGWHVARSAPLRQSASRDRWFSPHTAPSTLGVAGSSRSHLRGGPPDAAEGALPDQPVSVFFGLLLAYRGRRASCQQAVPRNNGAPILLNV